ncbi:hypothetical protein CHISP_2264 [Chitinispirillum alkaliphilum]|nr:hypothetical protein CHISP_2264 [Chitinispirillum alkaliphilum]
MNLFLSRIIRASKLEANLYEEVEADKSSITHAVAVVILSSFAAGLGSATPADPLNLLSNTLGAFIGWVLWAFFIYIIGAKLFPQPQTEADYGQLLRTIGFSASPGIIRIAGVYQPLRETLFFIVAIWMFAAMVVAARQALDYTTTLRSLMVCLGGWFLQILLLGLILFSVQNF